MKRLVAIFVMAMVLMLPAVLRAENHLLSDEELDGIHARGLMVFLDFNMFLIDWSLPDTSHSGIKGGGSDGSTDPEDTVVDTTTISDSFNNIHLTVQEVGDNNNGNVLQNSVQLNGNAQQNLRSLVNINAASSVIPFGINITVIYGDNYGTIDQRNLSLGMFRSSLFLLGGI